MQDAVPGYGCWLGALAASWLTSLIASPCYSDGIVPASGLQLSRDCIMHFRLISHLFKNSHRIPTEPMGI